MATWLDDEERKHAAQREADDLRIRTRLAAEKETLACLSEFHAFCARVNAVRHGSLNVRGLITTGPSRPSSGRPFRSAKPESWSRGLAIASEAYDQVFVDAVKNTIWRNSGSDADYTPYERSETLVRTACRIGDLQTWADSAILQCIKWILNETNEVGKSLPGHEILNGESEIVIRYDKRHNDKDPDKIEVLLDGAKLGWGWVGSHELDTQLADTGRTFRISKGWHELTVRGLGATASVQIDAPAYGVLFYRASFGFLSSLRLGPCSPEGRE